MPRRTGISIRTPAWSDTAVPVAPMKPFAKRGAVAGLIAGIPLLVIVCAAASAAGLATTLPIAWIGALIYGDDAMQGGGQGVLGGLGVHAITCALLGALYAIATRPLPRAVGAQLGSGLVFGVVVWVAMVFVLIPRANPFLAERIAGAPVAWLIAHVAFGLTLGLAYRYLRPVPAPAA